MRSSKYLKNFRYKSSLIEKKHGKIKHKALKFKDLGYSRWKTFMNKTSGNNLHKINKIKFSLI